MKKRILSLILTIVLCILNVGVFSAEPADMNDEYKKAEDILEAVGVFERYDIQSDFEQSISRADFISMCIASAFPGVSGEDTAESPFADVNKTTGAYKYICAAHKMGIISGNGNGNFRPADPVTYDEALKILVSILGYDLIAEERGGFPQGYRATANTLDLGVGMSDEVVNNFTYGDCLVLFLNALNTEINELSAISTDKISFRVGETLMYNAFKISKGQGILKENPYTTLTSSKNNDDSGISIGNFSGHIYAGVDKERYLGYEVDFYYQEDAAGDYVLYIGPTDRNRVTYISSENFVTVSDRTINYYPTADSQAREIDIPASARVIYNGKAYPDYQMTIFEEKDADFYLIDNNADGVIDVVNATKWNSVFVYQVDTKEERIIDKYDGSSMISLKDKPYIIWDNNFNQLKLSDIKAGVVANSVTSLDGEYVRVIITDNKKSGTIQSQTTRNGNTVLSLDGTEYIVADSYLKKISVLPNLGSTATFYFDYTGRIAAIDSDNTGFQYGYIIGATKNGIVFGDHIKIKLMKNNGTIVTLETEDDLKVDDNSYADSMFDTLNTPQVIRYKLTDEGKIKEIDTVTQGLSESENSLRALTPRGTMHYFPTSKAFGGTYDDDGTFDDNANIYYCMLVPDANTLLYIVPNPSSGMGDESDYRVTTLDYMAGSSITKKVFQGFNANADSYTPDVVYMQNDGGGNLSRGKNPALVTGVFKTLNKDKKTATQLDVVNNKGETASLVFTTVLEQSGVSVNAGDFINYTFDMYNEVSDIKVVCTKDGICNDSAYTTGYYGQDFNPYYGTALDRQGSMIVMENTAYTGQVYYLPVGNAPIYVVEKLVNDYTVKKGTVDDIYDEEHFGSADASKVFYYTFQTVPRMVVVYR